MIKYCVGMINDNQSELAIAGTFLSAISRTLYIVRQIVLFIFFLSFCGNVAAMSVIGCVRDRSMNLSPPSIAVCANCRWRWPEALGSRREHAETGFLIWHKTKNRYLCYLCAQSCPDLREKNPRNFVFSTYKECQDKRQECMLPPSDQSVVTWDKHFREVWQKPWVSDEALSVEKSSESNDLLSGICQLQSSVISLQEELSGLAQKLENLKEVVMHSADKRSSS